MMAIDEISKAMIAAKDTMVSRCRLNQLLLVSFNLYSYLLNTNLSFKVRFGGSGLQEQALLMRGLAGASPATTFFVKQGRYLEMENSQDPVNHLLSH